VLWTAPKSLETEWRNRLKQIRIRIHEKSNCPMSNTFMPLLALSTCLTHRCKQRQKKMKLGWGWTGSVFDNELKKRIISRQSGIFTTSLMGLCHAICYIFKKLKLFLHQLNSKNNGPVLLFKTILALILFPSSVAMDCNWLELRPTTRYMTYTNQMSTWPIQIRKVTKKVTLK